MKVKKKGAKRKFDHSGSSFDSFLQEEGIRDDVEAVAIKRVLAWQLEQRVSFIRATLNWIAYWTHGMCPFRWTRWLEPLRRWARIWRSESPTRAREEPDAVPRSCRELPSISQAVLDDVRAGRTSQRAPQAGSLGQRRTEFGNCRGVVPSGSRKHGRN